MYEGPKAIIFSQDAESAENISAAVSEYGIKNISVSAKGERDLLSKNRFDLAIVNAPLENEFGLELAVFAAAKGSAVIIAAPAKMCGEMAKKIGAASVFILPKPMNKTLLVQTVRFVMLSRDNALALQNENAKLEIKLKDAKLVDRAKCVLVEYLRVSEADAHRQIQKRAMDMRIPLAEAAREILKTYET